MNNFRTIVNFSQIMVFITILKDVQKDTHPQVYQGQREYLAWSGLQSSSMYAYM